MVQGGLTAWSIEACSKRAGCAKGLVLHYFGSKEALLRTIARSLVADRSSRWAGAFGAAGISGLDALWDVLAQEATAGSARALLELRLAGVTESSFAPEDADKLVRRLAAALDQSTTELPVPGAIEQLLEGYLLALLRGVAPDDVREAFFRYWLSYVR
jgi:AcrR family transcriptional regulator